MGIRFRKVDGPPSIDTYVDAGYGIDNIRRSITGYVSHVAGGAVTWRSHLQPTVADSPNTAEYIALHEAAVTSMSLFNLMIQMGYKVNPPTIFEDNDGCRRLALAGMGQNGQDT